MEEQGSEAHKAQPRRGEAAGGAQVSPRRRTGAVGPRQHTEPPGDSSAKPLCSSNTPGTSQRPHNTCPGLPVPTAASSACSVQAQPARCSSGYRPGSAGELARDRSRGCASSITAANESPLPDCLCRGCSSREVRALPGARAGLAQQQQNQTRPRGGCPRKVSSGLARWLAPLRLQARELALVRT